MYCATICKEGGAKKKKIQLLAHICIKSFWKEFYGLPLGMHPIAAINAQAPR